MRKSTIKRTTRETDIALTLELDGIGQMKGSSGIGFFDHMLHSLIKMSNCNLDIQIKGDLEVDNHHSIEDIGIVLGQAFHQSLGAKEGIERMASMYVPMDDTLVLCALDFSGRSYLAFDVELPLMNVGTMETELVEEFFRAFVNHAKCNIHLKLIHGKNVHHMIEAIFKAAGRAIYKAIKINSDVIGVLSTKDKL